MVNILIFSISPILFSDLVAAGTQRVKGPLSDMEKMLEATVRHMDEVAPKMFF